MSFVKKWGDNSTDDYNSCLEDVYMYKDNPDITHDDDNIWLGTFASTNRITRSLIRFAIKDDLTLLGATSIISAKLYLYTNTLNGTHNVSAFRVVQDWNEAELTWNSFKSGGSWNSPGVESTSDSAVDDDVTYDRFATAEDIKSSGSVGGYNCILDLTSLAQKWFSGDNKEYGIFLLSDNEAINNNVQFIDHEGADGNRPYLEIEYEIVFDPNDWANKLKLVIDSSKIDENIINFPVLITLSSGSGQTGFDATDVFDELATVSGSYDNRKKIAVTTTISGVETELYVEIETWDDTTSSGNKQAWLWTKVPTISLCTDTDLYLYYDSAHTTNSGYVGDTGETPAQNVWGSNFDGVWHMAQDPSGGSNCILDSTSSGNNGTPDGTMTSANLVDGKIGNGIDFDGADDDIVLGSNIVLDSTSTLFILMKSRETSTQQVFSGATAIGRFALNDTVFMAWFTAAANENVAITHGVDISEYHLYTFVRNGAVASLYVDGEFVESKPLITDSMTLYNIAGKDFATSWAYTGGVIDEFVVSDCVRPAAWIKASYYSNWDDLIILEKASSYYFSGTVYELGSTISGAQIFMYRRDTGGYLGSTTSSGDGGFYVETTYSGSHFLVCLDPVESRSYNDLIYGEMYPVTISG